MPAHKDKFRSAPTSKAYKDNHDAIFGPAKGAEGMDEEKLAEHRRDHHNKLAEDGKKPADWYLSNERRVSQNPDYAPQRLPTAQYKARHKDIFGG